MIMSLDWYEHWSWLLLYNLNSNENVKLIKLKTKYKIIPFGFSLESQTYSIFNPNLLYYYMTFSYSQ